MDSSPNIHQRMLAVMKDISYVQKSDKTVNNQYRFVTHDAVTAKVRGAMIEHGIVATTDVVGHQQDGNRTEVDVRVRFVNVDSPEDAVEVNAFGYGIDPQDKGPGKAISYAVKYAYLKAFALETGDDPERDSIDHEPAKPTAARPAGRPAAAIPANVEGHDLWAKLDNDTRDMLTGYAEAATKLVAEGKDAHGYMQALGLDDDTKLALWTKLPAPVRAAIKKGAPKVALSTQP